MPEEYENLAEAPQDSIQEQHAEAHEAMGRPGWIDALAVTTALFAVLAAFASLKAGDNANEALYQANLAVLQQAKAVDVWGEYQADSIKKYQAATLVTLLPHAGGSAAEVQAARAQVAQRQQSQDTLRAEAMKLDQATVERSRDSELLLARHTKFALGVTLFQVAIGLAAIATLIRRRPLWFVSLVVGGAASVALAAGFLTHGA